MDNMIMKYTTSDAGKVLTSVSKQAGKYGWIAPISIYLAYTLCNDIMDKGYMLDFKVNADGIGLKLSKPETIH